MKKTYQDLIKNTGILAISNFASKILIFLLVPLYTSVLTTEEYGFYDLTYTMMVLLLPILTLNISDGVIRFCLEKKYDKKDIISIGIKFWIISAVTITVLLIVNYIFSIIKEIKEYTLLINLYYVFFFLYSILSQSAKGLEKVKEMGIAGVISSIVMLGLNILFLKVYYIGLKGFYIANIFAQFIPAVYLIIKLNIFKYINLNVDNQIQKKMISYSAPLAINSLGWWANNNIDRYIMTWIVDLGCNGLLSVAYKLPSVIEVIGSIFTQAWQISAIKEYEKSKETGFFKTMYLYLNIILGLGVGIIIIFNKFIASILFRSDFYIAWQFVPFLLISAWMNQISGYIGPILSAQYKSKVMAKSAIFGIIANITLNILFGKILGAIGIPIATAIASLVILYFREKGTEKILRGKEFNRVFIIWGLVLVMSILEVFFGLKTFQVLLYLMILIVYKNEILEAIKRGVSVIKDRSKRKDEAKV